MNIFRKFKSNGYTDLSNQPTDDNRNGKIKLFSKPIVDSRNGQAKPPSTAKAESATSTEQASVAKSRAVTKSVKVNNKETKIGYTSQTNYGACNDTSSPFAEGYSCRAEHPEAASLLPNSPFPNIASVIPEFKPSEPRF